MRRRRFIMRHSNRRESIYFSRLIFVTSKSVKPGKHPLAGDRNCKSQVSRQADAVNHYRFKIDSSFLNDILALYES
jgi:hypothetical protein